MASVVAQPLLVLANTLGRAKKMATDTFKDSLRVIYGVARGSLTSVTGGLRDLARTSPHLLRQMATVSNRALREFSRYSAISFRTFLRVAERATGSPESIIVAVLMYKLTDHAVSVSPDTVVKFFDDVKAEISKIEITPIELSFPAVDLSGWKTAVRTFFYKAKTHIENVKKSLVVEEPSPISLGCGAPPAWYEVAEYFRYGLCMLGEHLINALARLGYYIMLAMVKLAQAILDFIIAVLGFIEEVLVAFISFIELVATGLLKALEVIGNFMIKAVCKFVNFLLSFVVKPLVSVLIDYVLKPLAVFIVNAYNWIKNAMRTCLCWYLKLSPFALGFRLATRYMSRKMEKGGFLGLKDIFKHGLFGMLGILVSTTLATSFLIMVVAPECSLIPEAEAIMPAPPAPTPIGYEYVPMTHLSTVRLALYSREEYEFTEYVVYKSTAYVRTAVAERYEFIAPVEYRSTVYGKITVDEKSTWYSPVEYRATAYVKLNVTE